MSEILGLVIVYGAMGGAIYTVYRHYTCRKKGGRVIETLFPSKALWVIWPMFLFGFGAIVVHFRLFMRGEELGNPLLLSLFALIFVGFACFVMFATAIAEDGITIGSKFYPYDRVKLSWDNSKAKDDKVFVTIHLESASLSYELPTAVAGKVKRLLFGKVAQN